MRSARILRPTVLAEGAGAGRESAIQRTISLRRKPSQGSANLAWQTTGRGRDLGTDERREKRLGASERGASARQWVVSQRLRHVRTIRSTSLTGLGNLWGTPV